MDCNCALERNSVRKGGFIFRVVSLIFLSFKLPMTAKRRAEKQGTCQREIGGIVVPDLMPKWYLRTTDASGVEIVMRENGRVRKCRR